MKNNLAAKIFLGATVLFLLGGIATQVVGMAFLNNADLYVGGVASMLISLPVGMVAASSWSKSDDEQLSRARQKTR
ncbi:MAG: hypothetical protein FWD15_03305 [Alphaproteobacteria bacterium]|nr:hypothetical protein [Alphaproteobacteria bacterium]